MTNVRVTTTDGLTFISKSNDYYVSKSLDVYGEWSHGEVEILRHFIRPAGKVYAFEPRRGLFQTLCGNLAINGIENVHAFQIGLGDASATVTEGTMDFSAPLNAGGIMLGDLPGTQETFEIRMLDDVVNSKERITLIKTDVEGHELKVLKGATKIIERDRPVLYLENDKPDLSQALIAHIWALDYDAWWHAVPLFNPNNLAKTPHNIFGNTVSLNMICLPKDQEPPAFFGTKIKDATAHPLIPTDGLAYEKGGPFGPPLIS